MPWKMFDKEANTYTITEDWSRLKTKLENF